MNREKTAIVVIALAILLLTALGGGKVVTDTLQVMEEFGHVHQKMHSVQQERAQLEALGDDFSRYEEEVETIQNLFFDPDKPLDFIGFLEGMAESLGLQFRIQSIHEATASSEEDEVPWKGVVVRTASIGQFAEVMRFLEAMENAPFLVRIESVGMEEVREQAIVRDFSSPAPDDILLTLSLRVFVSEDHE